MIHLNFILFIAYKLDDYIDKINYPVLYLGNIKTTCSNVGMHSTLLYHVRRMGATQQNYYRQKGSLSHLPHM